MPSKKSKKQSDKKAVKKSARKAINKTAVQKKNATQLNLAKLQAEVGNLRFHSKRIRITEGGNNVNFVIQFFNGRGSMNFSGENIHRTEREGTKGFSANQRSGLQQVAVSGAAPSGDEGKIEVQVLDNAGNILSAVKKYTYKNVFMKKLITYIVP